MIVSELLCFLLNNYGRTHVKNIKDVIVDFYTSDEIDDAKKILHAELKKLNIDNLPRAPSNDREIIKGTKRVST